MNPNTWRLFIKPQLKRMFDLIKSRGKSICLHSCGNISAILGDLIEIGLDIYQTVQPEIYDLAAIKKEYGASLTFYGAISTQRDLPFKPAGEITRIVKETMRILGSGGGYIAAPTHRITPDVPADNILAMIDAFKNQSD
jgi:uroporphyrinogen decarboxylase